MDFNSILTSAKKALLDFVYMITKGFNYYHFYK
jgi:hypothetical protein